MTIARPAEGVRCERIHVGPGGIRGGGSPIVTMHDAGFAAMEYSVAGQGSFVPGKIGKGARQPVKKQNDA